MISLSLRQQLAAVLLPAVVLAGCGGGPSTGDVSSDETRGLLSGNRLLPPDVSSQQTPAADPVQTAIVDLGLVDPNQAVRVDVASNEFGPLSIDQFSVALLDEDPTVRQAAIDAVIGAPEEIVRERLELLSYALTDPDEAVRESVVAVLEGLRDPRSVALLLEARRDSSLIVREEAREALTELRNRYQRTDEESQHSGD